MAYWLIKSDPETYSWDHLVRDKTTTWDGVRNYQARNNLALMQRGDKLLFYHSQTTTSIVGLAELTKEAFPDPTTEDPRWLTVEIKALYSYKNPVLLSQIKSDEILSQIALVKQSRLSVMPISQEQFDRIEELAQ